MRLVIPHKLLKFTLVLGLFALFISCNQSSEEPKLISTETVAVNYRNVKKIELKTPFGATLDTTLSITTEDQVRGLSGVADENFSENEAMLFFYIQDSMHHFWMPNTYFDLDLFYLDKDFRVIGIQRKLPHFPQPGPDHLVPRADPFFCRHVLEMKSSSDIAAKIRMGMNLRWTSQPSPQQIESSIRRER